MITWKEVGGLLRIVWRWSWLIVLAVVLAAGTAFMIMRGEQRFYVARATVQIGNTFETQLVDNQVLGLGTVLGRFYSEMAKREVILQPVGETLQLTFPWTTIRDVMLRTSVNPSANLLDIEVTDTDPVRAAAIANAVGEQLIAYSPTSPEKVQAEQAAIQQQLDSTQQRNDLAQAQLNDLLTQRQQATSASDLAELNRRIDELQRIVDQEQAAYNQLLVLKSRGTVNKLEFLERAEPPQFSLPSRRVTVVAIAGVASFLLALVAIFVIDRLDRRWRTLGDVNERLNIPSLGDIPKGPPIRLSAEPFMVTRQAAVQNVQTNLLLAASERGSRTLLITSPQSSELRASFSIDLADLFARSGHRVLLVDADTTNAFLTHAMVPQGGTKSWAHLSDKEYSGIWAYLRPTPIPKIALLPAGDGKGAPAMLSSQRWRNLVRSLYNTADIIIFDGPAALQGPDAALLAPYVDGVVMALDPVVDDREVIARSRERLLHHKNARLLGAVSFVAPEQSGFRWPFGRSQQPAIQAVGLLSPPAPEAIITPPPEHTSATDQHDTMAAQAIHNADTTMPDDVEAEVVIGEVESATTTQQRRAGRRRRMGSSGNRRSRD